MNAERQESMGKQKKVTAICLLCAGNIIASFISSFTVIAIKQLNVTGVILILFYLVICSPAFTEKTTDVPNSLEALESSCVVIPCSFTAPAEHLSSSSLTGIWYRLKKQREVVYDEDKSRVAENFRGRTRMLGRLSQKNCTLEIIKIKEQDSGRYCFIAFLREGETDASRSDKLSAPDHCVSLKTLRMRPTF